METISRIRGLWSSMRSVRGVQCVSEEAAEVLSIKERCLARAFTSEQRRAYDDAERNSSTALEEIRAEGERRCEEIFDQKQEENMRKILFATSALGERHG